MTSLIERLHAFVGEDVISRGDRLMKEAADELERKDAEIARLRYALTEIKGIPTYLQSRRDNYANKVHKAHDIAAQALADTESSGGSERRSLLPPRNWTESSDER